MNADRIGRLDEISYKEMKVSREKAEGKYLKKFKSGEARLPCGEEGSSAWHMFEIFVARSKLSHLMGQGSLSSGGRLVDTE